MMKKFILITIGLLLSVSIKAQHQGAEYTEEQYEKYITEIRPYKHQFIAKELELTKEQQREFFPIYDEMEDKIRKLTVETRELERKTLNNPNATDTEISLAAQAVFQQQLKEGEIENSYFEKFSKILNNKQLLRLKNTERKFTQGLMKQHRRIHREKTDAPTPKK